MLVTVIVLLVLAYIATGFFAVYFCCALVGVGLIVERPPVWKLILLVLIWPLLLL